MLPVVSEETYNRVESESHSDPYGFIDRVVDQISSTNPEILTLIERWMKQYEGKDWLAPSVAYACVVYRLLELSTDQLPIVMQRTAKPLEQEFWGADDPRFYFRDQLARILSENRYVAMAAVWSTFDAIVQNDRTAVSFITILGVMVYRYLEKEAELDNAPKPKAVVN
jgi:hypothetical protein